jgi:hypothetical protein
MGGLSVNENAHERAKSQTIRREYGGETVSQAGGGNSAAQVTRQQRETAEIDADALWDNSAAAYPTIASGRPPRTKTDEFKKTRAHMESPQ